MTKTGNERNLKAGMEYLFAGLLAAKAEVDALTDAPVNVDVVCCSATHCSGKKTERNLSLSFDIRDFDAILYPESLNASFVYSDAIKRFSTLISVDNRVNATIGYDVYPLFTHRSVLTISPASIIAENEPGIFNSNSSCINENSIDWKQVISRKQHTGYTLDSDQILIRVENGNSFTNVDHDSRTHFMLRKVEIETVRVSASGDFYPDCLRKVG